MRRIWTPGLVAAAIALLVGFLPGCRKQSGSSAQPSGESSQSTPVDTPVRIDGLTVVKERNLVCMVNDQFMGKPQIPVSVNGKTYFGCCPMCKERLARDSGVRTAMDPMSRKTVDKADAIMAKTESGDILYFESTAHLAAYGRAKGL